MKRFSEFVNEKVEGEPVFSWERADMWFERIKKEPEIQEWVGRMIMPDSEYNRFKKIINKVLYKYRNDLYPKEIEYIKEKLLDLIFDLEVYEEK